MSEREIGCFLSGGLDSSLITGLVAKNKTVKIKNLLIINFKFKL